ncbi:hypothetical protein FRC07_004157 [Ceratobasidium sp. 392]|nr:hypothetical protein FRC07_004157 [Ceratobasidium sp. 392]
MSYSNQGSRHRTTGTEVAGAERFNILRPNLHHNSVTQRVSQLSLTAATSTSPEVGRSIRWLLGEIQKTRFEDNALQIVAYASALEREQDGRLLSFIVDLIFWSVQAKPELSTAHIFVRLSDTLVQEILPTVRDRTSYDTDGELLAGSDLVRRYFADRCHHEMDRAWERKSSASNSALAVRLDQAQRARVEVNEANECWLVLVQFLHGLYEHCIIGEGPLHWGIKQLLSESWLHKQMDAVTLRTILFESKHSRVYQARDWMDMYYVEVYKLTRSGKGEIKHIYEVWNQYV